MVARGEKDIYGPTLTRAMLLLDAQRRTERVLIRDEEDDPPS
jgi:hypothetical protein